MSNSRLLFVTTLFLGVFIYFLYHTVYGNRGFISRERIKTKITETFNTLDKTRSDRLELENNVKLLRPGSLDKDMLEEQARKVLGVAKEGEEVIVNEPTATD